MDARLLVIIGVIAFILLIVLFAVAHGFAFVLAQPLENVASLAYLAAIIVFIFFLSGAGYLVNEKIT